ncbi:SUMF1/EgtB/PvdO family nonheme iron enzyme [Nannocystis bainbridge]|uniref:SUMF1/EgtB/PvdO family nonheme iron enzyme n=1 Tax=Nannocystis bainbridge TaxID=2995303 RepID=A0ABT5E9M8_9BACT|nr:SUMF1/EgtB/PvdO family nonheme iron enzyme [Nannocystis bainbridge]MDC0721623.1 SUMF1/EgtB/PvdO family nonheme iron enzyme [Nannocystis bainbridge]
MNPTNSVPAVGARPIRWLHLSDLHVGGRGEAQWWQVLEDFWRSLDIELGRLGAPDMVLLTGDLTNRGAREEFEQLTQFLESLLAKLPRAEDGLPPLIVPVPGNHDLARPVKREALTYRVLRDYELGRGDPDVAAVMDDLWEASDASFIKPLFANYVEWFDHYVKPQAIRPGVKLHASFFPGDFWLQVALPGRFPLGVIGLNSAWLQVHSGDYAEKLAVPVEQFQASLPRTAGHSPLTALTSVHRALLLMHHPRNWLSKSSRQDFDGSIYPGDRFVACLHGHMHEAGAVNLAHFGGAPRCFYQAPSLFGLEQYGTKHESRLFGYTWGQLESTGDLRAWPLRWLRKGDGVGAFERDPFFHWNDAGGVLLRKGDGRAYVPPRSSGPIAVSPAAASVGEPAAILAYRTWLLRQRQGVELIGVGGGDMQLDLDSVYVPLRVQTLANAEHDAFGSGDIDLQEGRRRPKAHSEHERKSSGRRGDRSVDGTWTRRAPQERAELAHEALACCEFEVDALFQKLETPHALILGSPGSGKTTALHKLLHRCVREGGKALGLRDGVVPVALRLRRFHTDRVGQSLAGWLSDELVERSGGELPAALGAELWRHGRLLLLADGLDEIADEALRAELCKQLMVQLSGSEAVDVRAVVSCRHAGYRKDVRLDKRFARLDLRPLSPEQVRTLVQLWFEEAGRVMTSVSAVEAAARAGGLIAAIESPGFSSQRLKVMVSTPLLLTLLCVIVNQGREMPRNRAAYYEECLRVLLLRWGQSKQQIAPLDFDSAMAVLRSLAFELHRSGERDAWVRAKLALHINQRLRALGKPGNNGLAVVEWLYRGAGVLKEFAAEHFGFFHLGVQEFLAAAHIAAVGEKRDDETTELPLDMLVRHLDRGDDTWWIEVTRLLVALPGRSVYAPLLQRVLRSPAREVHGGLVGDLLEEAAEADPEPLITRLHEKIPASERVTLLRLLRKFSGDPRVSDAAKQELATTTDETVRVLAGQLCEEAPGEGRALVLVFTATQRRTAESLALQLTGNGVSVWKDRKGQLLDALDLQSELDMALAAGCGVAALCDQTGPAWATEAAASCMSLFADAEKAVACVVLPKSTVAAQLPPGATLINLQRRDGLSELQRWLARAQPRRGRGIVVNEPFIEPVTGIRFLWLPGGPFEMGEKGIAEKGVADPIHWVQVSPYWLAETPVTNAQYGAFLAANRGHSEPQMWRDERYAGDTRPVVTVSWDDAIKFCAWLSTHPALVTAGVRVQLPSEAQWEFAARSTDGRRYPWGNDKPEASRAVFGRKYDGPLTTAPVGSCPAGRGPFGHLDLIGNVWEWCLDDWEAKAYEGRSGQRSVDPVVKHRRTEERALRGGGWALDKARAAATRSGDVFWSYSNNRGFRVAAVLANH